jgi:cytoskeletal protein CcmA (bactofilin family)
MFRSKSDKSASGNSVVKSSSSKKNVTPTVITKDLNVLGNIISEGNIDFDGTLNGNIRCDSLTIRTNGHIKGEVVADTVNVYGVIKGVIRAKHVNLFAHCNVEGIIMHETITIEDGAMVDGKFKRTNRVQPANEIEAELEYAFENEASADPKVLENIRLIR